MELNLDEFFDLVLDYEPHFSDDVEEEDDFGRFVFDPYVKYHNFVKSDDYNSYLFINSRKIILNLKKDYSLEKINSLYLENYLNALILEKENFTFQKIQDQEHLIHNKAFITSNAVWPFDVKYDINNTKSNKIINEYVFYNKYRYDIILYLIVEIEKILKIKRTEKKGISIGINHSNEISKLEMNLPVASIALLYRLLDEENLLKYKKKTEIYRFISSAIKSANQENISEASVKNKFLSPDNSSIKSLDTILVNLRQILKNIE